MLNKDAIGAEGPSFEMCVEEGKIAEFAEAIGAQSKDHFGREATIPPTFLTTTFFWEARVPGANPWHLVEMSQERGMHAEQSYRFFGPPPQAGQRLTCTSRIETIYEKKGRSGGSLEFGIMVTEFRDEAGNLVAEARMTGVETSKPPEEK